MGLLDAITSGSQGGYGGLLDLLMQKSPLLQPQEAAQPQYDAMGNSFGSASIPQAATSPFPDVSATNYAQFAPKQGAAGFSPFNGGAAPTPFAAPQAAVAGPTIQPQQPQQPAAPVSQASDINVGGYQMPRFGSATDFTPQQTPTDVSAQSRQPVEPQQSPQAQQPLPAAFGGGSVLSRLGNPDGLIARLTGNDSRTVSQQMLKAKYDNYMANGLTHSQAMLAAINPKASEVADQRILEKKKYGFTKLDNDTVVNQDPDTGKVSVAYGGGAEAKSVAGPDGKPIQIPEGLDSAARKTFVNAIMHANADAATGKLTEVQAKSQKFGNQMELAQQNIKGLEAEGKSIFGQIASGVPLGNLVQSKDYQKYTQAKNSFLTAILRDESGAAIGSQEFVRREKEMFPQPGDDADTMRQKAQLRHVAVEGMKKAAGPGYKAPSEVTSSPGLPSGWSVQVR